MTEYYTPADSLSSDPQKLDVAPSVAIEEEIYPRLRHVKLSSIAHVHTRVEQFYTELSIPPTRMAPLDHIKGDDIKSLIQGFPIRVAKENSRLRCTGNIRLFQVAKEKLPPETEVFCIEELEPTPAQLRSRLLTEVILGPALMGNHTSDVRIVAEIAEKSGYLKKFGKFGRTMLASLYGVDRRQIRSQSPVVPEKSSEPAATPIEQPNGLA
jgi:hypothetical protein